jgi:hypothetical protein
MNTGADPGLDNPVNTTSSGSVSQGISEWISYAIWADFFRVPLLQSHFSLHPGKCGSPAKIACNSRMIFAAISPYR